MFRKNLLRPSSESKNVRNLYYFITVIVHHMNLKSYLHGRPTIGGPPAWGLDEGLTDPHRKSQIVTKCYTGPRNWHVLVNTILKLRVL
jgi:hypothetical protein